MNGPTWFYCGLHKWLGDERCLYCRGHAQEALFEDVLDEMTVVTWTRFRDRTSKPEAV